MIFDSVFINFLKISLRDTFICVKNFLKQALRLRSMSTQYQEGEEMGLTFFYNSFFKIEITQGFPGSSQNPPANAGDAGDSGLIPGSERSPGGGNGNPLQHSCWKQEINKIKQNPHTIQLTHLKSIIQWFLEYPHICETITIINFRTIPPLQKEDPYPLAIISQHHRCP